jgi:hypothetical protein
MFRLTRGFPYIDGTTAQRGSLMAADKNDDPMEAMISSRVPRRTRQTINPANSFAMLTEQSTAEEKVAQQKAKTEARESESAPLRPPRHSQFEGRLEVRPIGTALGLRELAALHKRTWSTLNVQEKRVHRCYGRWRSILASTRWVWATSNGAPLCLARFGRDAWLTRR